ncbi:DUF3299 domain-containing protein [Ruegeria sp. HKCCD6109]|uniref:DUF3299 domain-containing protein n=1 Tax=Ruegeria sp. HKCCD6109 TaxID=2683017 RepID=UPI001491B316|nr:DUF3299 domain-containing protein [Ruegeria sp. HKCCD6109]NOD65835.1 DUF3299 domain-containing protein [Ruegeria sp. HKCCD6109]
MRKTVDRRFVLIGATISVVIPLRALAEDIVQLQWGDLLPEGTVLPNLPVGIISRDGASQISQQPVSTGIRTDWNGQTVRLPGFIIPIEFESTSVATFILVPFVGACIHVPPPPANQLVLVRSEIPYEGASLFDPVSVTGTFDVASNSTDLADIGYTIDANKIESHD